MTEELEQMLTNLKLRRMLNVCDEQLQADKRADPLHGVRGGTAAGALA
jgi:hypothetical protein